MFDELARRILALELHRYEQLPPERVLASNFMVSRLIVRQALHRLAELGMVEVRQGGATVVGDLDAIHDPKVLELFYRLVPRDKHRPSDVADIIEKQYMQGLSLVEVASRRASPDRLALLVSTTEKERPTTAAGVEQFEHEFWSLLAAIGKNRIFILEVAWWRNVFPDRPIPQEVASAEPDARMAFYRELARRLRDHDHPVEYYIAAVRPILDGVLSRASK